MKRQDSPGYQVLREGRISQTNARYFITICTLNREPILCQKDTPELVFEHLQHSQNTFYLIASVVMPDHLHMVVQLLSEGLSKAIQVFKSRSAISINRSLRRKGALWQTGFYDHKFRSDEDLAPILNYMWNNPETSGSNFRCRKEDWIWFKSVVTEDVTYPAWLKDNPMG